MATADCVPGETEGTFDCELVVPFYRNFATLDDEKKDVQFSIDDMNRSFLVTGWLEMLDFKTFDLQRVGSFARTQKTQKMVSKLAIDI
mmetsp:Transcript_9775/g.12068  ORF Transcript_9775/g.12068 Transcript_9775/m.12068 type:complete len:88 (+) Transcript_9775:461-724(+)|eukprot:CAMPEP_0170456742 /NCGR_PEP_ID=MMETSP0123-20130129/4267_1 /TAXON_ID=182087 /ORGANISM="Favella ehrenbergii, Strain Fehren 1" /LENGTH=87 /DNA_ID=CAMNT_0010720305 /DNA_START=362 /DNA_END=625 /DNA_ORIENTATION=+